MRKRRYYYQYRLTDFSFFGLNRRKSFVFDFFFSPLQHVQTMKFVPLVFVQGYISRVFILNFTVTVMRAVFMVYCVVYILQ